MHRVHHFWTSSDALDASHGEGEVREDDVLVVVGERVVGLASTDPIAITINAGVLRAFPALATAMPARATISDPPTRRTAAPTRTSDYRSRA